MKISYEQGRGNAFARHIRKQNSQTVRADIEKIVIASAYLARRNALARVVDACQVASLIWKELLLNVARDLQFGFYAPLGPDSFERLACLLADCAQQTGVVPGLLHKIARAPPHGFHRELD